jgi:23S rRNA (adenine2503-C2)-methyltransferase
MAQIAASTADDKTLESLFHELGQPQWRARQLRDAVWRPNAMSLDSVREFSAELRAKLADAIEFSTVSVAERSVADGGLTTKLLCRLGDGETVEAVAMETPARRSSKRRSTVCVSSQVGCAVGCPFCATGQMGLRRNCTAAEIVDQVRAASTELSNRGLGPVTHVVYMGMGEPLANYQSTVESLRVLHANAGISARRITVSTSGVVPKIQQLATEKLPVTLAISLHASDNALRDRLVPLNKRFPLKSLVEAGEMYAEETGRRVTLEWCLIGGVNDSDAQSRGLKGIAHKLSAHVNIIPMNHIEGSPWGPPTKDQTQRFLAQLDGIRHTVRDTRGAETDAACGQLRAGLEQRRWVTPEGVLSAPRSASRTEVKQGLMGVKKQKENDK